MRYLKLFVKLPNRHRCQVAIKKAIFFSHSAQAAFCLPVTCFPLRASANDAQFDLTSGLKC